MGGEGVIEGGLGREGVKERGQSKLKQTKYKCIKRKRNGIIMRRRRGERSFVREKNLPPLTDRQADRQTSQPTDGHEDS